MIYSFAEKNFRIFTLITLDFHSFRSTMGVKKSASVKRKVSLFDSILVSEQLRSHPSPNPTLTLNLLSIDCSRFKGRAGVQFL